MIKIVCDTEQERTRVSRILRLGEAVLLSVDCILKQDMWEENKARESIQWEVGDNEG